MKKFLLFVAVFLLFQQWPTIKDFLYPPKDYSYLPATYVTMYSTEWCGYCAKMRVFMARRNIAYDDLDIEKSAQAKRNFEALGGGGVPLLVVNKQVVRGYNPNLVLHHLDAIELAASTVQD